MTFSVRMSWPSLCPVKVQERLKTENRSSEALVYLYFTGDASPNDPAWHTPQRGAVFMGDARLPLNRVANAGN